MADDNGKDHLSQSLKQFLDLLENLWSVDSLSADIKAQLQSLLDHVKTHVNEYVDEFEFLTPLLGGLSPETVRKIMEQPSGFLKHIFVASITSSLIKIEIDKNGVIQVSLLEFLMKERKKALRNFKKYKHAKDKKDKALAENNQIAMTNNLQATGMSAQDIQAFQDMLSELKRLEAEYADILAEYAQLKSELVEIQVKIVELEVKITEDIKTTNSDIYSLMAALAKNLHSDDQEKLDKIQAKHQQKIDEIDSVDDAQEKIRLQREYISAVTEDLNELSKNLSSGSNQQAVEETVSQINAKASELDQSLAEKSEQLAELVDQKDQALEKLDSRREKIIDRADEILDLQEKAEKFCVLHHQDPGEHLGQHGVFGSMPEEDLLPLRNGGLKSRDGDKRESLSTKLYGGGANHEAHNELKQVHSDAKELQQIREQLQDLDSNIVNSIQEALKASAPVLNLDNLEIKELIFEIAQGVIDEGEIDFNLEMSIQDSIENMSLEFSADDFIEQIRTNLDANNSDMSISR